MWRSHLKLIISIVDQKYLPYFFIYQNLSKPLQIYISVILKKVVIKEKIYKLWF